MTGSPTDAVEARVVDLTDEGARTGAAGPVNIFITGDGTCAGPGTYSDYCETDGPTSTRAGERSIRVLRHTENARRLFSVFAFRICCRLKGHHFWKKGLGDFRGRSTAASNIYPLTVIYYVENTFIK